MGTTAEEGGGKGEDAHGFDRDVPPSILRALQLVQLLHRFPGWSMRR